MKKMIVVGLLGILAMVSMVCADTYTYSYVSAANSTNTSDAIPISGYLDRIELSGLGATRTNTILVASFHSNSGTNPIETYAAVTLTTPKVVKPRFQPTDTTGTVIPAVFSASGSSTNPATILTVPYEKALIGGNVKVVNKNDNANAVTNTITFYFEPLKK